TSVLEGQCSVEARDTSTDNGDVRRAASGSLKHMPGQTKWVGECKTGGESPCTFEEIASTDCGTPQVAHLLDRYALLGCLRVFAGHALQCTHLWVSCHLCVLQ